MTAARGPRKKNAQSHDDPPIEAGAIDRRVSRFTAGVRSYPL
jgi:hypothetical protein